MSSTPSDPQPPRGPGAGTTTPAALLGGHFDLLQELGSGSSSTVYRARLREDYGELQKGSEVAVKFLRRELVADERAQRRLEQEGRLGQQLRHPNLAAIHGVETISVLGLPVTYLVMEMVAGTTLRAFLQQQGPPVEDLTRRIGADAARGLAALHRQGVVHRDLKPENLVLTPDGGLKIVDLGLARPFGEAEFGGGSSPSPHGIGGSVAYTAPEVLRGRPTSPRSDLYALGVVLFEVTTGKHPFADCRTVDDMIHAHLFTPPTPPSHLRPRMSQLLEHLVLALLRKDPDQRPKDAAEVARILQQGEQSEWWRQIEQAAPALANGRRLRRLRRPAETPLFGRDDELALLRQHLAAAQRGAGTAVCVQGPVGSGRRRLLDEAMASWLDEQAPVLYLGGEADSGLGHGEPFASSLLDWLLRGDGRDSPHASQRAEARARELLQLGEGDAAALVAVAMGHSQEPPEVRADRLANALARLGHRDRVLVVRVEAADRLDTSGRMVLQRLLAMAGQRHLLLLLTAGPDGLQQTGGERLELTGLADSAFLAFGRALFRAGSDIDGFLAAAHQTLSGIPGNLLEALEHLVHEGLLAGQPGDYHDLVPGTEPRPAPGYVERFEQRVDRLPKAQRAVLDAAAVLGDRCRLGDLAALIEVPELLVLETLSLFRGRIVRAQGGEVSFRHRDFQKALLRRLPDTVRQQLHGKAADLLLARGAPALQVGLHRSQALDHEGCLDPLLAGLEELVQSGSRRTSLRIAARLRVHFQQLPRTEANERRRLRFLLLAAHARANVGQNAATMQAFRAAEALAQQLGDARGSADARIGLAAAALDDGRLLQAISLLETVHTDLADPTDGGTATLRARAHALHGRILLYLGQSDDGLKQLQAALQALPTDDVDLRCHLRIDLARMEALRHHYPTALKTLQRVEHERAARHLPRVQLRLQLYRGQIRTVLGDDEAVQDLRAAIAEAERLSLPGYGARACLFLGERAFWRGRDDEATDWFLRCGELAAASGDRLGGAMAAIHAYRLGSGPRPELAAIEELGLPELLLALHLAVAGRSRLVGDAVAADAATAAALALVRTADLPLPLHLRALVLADRPASARTLLRGIAERIPSRTSRRRFLREWERGVRI